MLVMFAVGVDSVAASPEVRPARASIALISAILAMSLATLDAAGRSIWQSPPLLVNSFLHFDGVQLLANVWVLMLFAPPLERRIGWRRLVALLAAVEVVDWLWYGCAPRCGASHWAMATMAAWCVLEPRSRVQMVWWLYLRAGRFVLPLWPWLVLAVCSDAIGGLRLHSAVAHAAHLLGASVGAGCAWWWRRA